MEKLKEYSAMGALVIVIAFLGFAYYLVGQASADAETWNRLFSLFSSLEALGFAAAGLLLGRSVGLPGARAIDALQRENAQLSAESTTMRHVTEELESDLQAARDILSDESELASKRIDAVDAVTRALMRTSTARATAITEMTQLKGAGA
ncbi:hypothetical protein [Tropicibacter oceani]|uniref:Uncharacterized protein n=1 Tax=Tropicibacter oceani TaxID=3058420 RepID=A0ABY8QD49_9RHOB|nr:hypothetical protein [Tropicibacter oceani]WGW02410.1 hypothetical protein QF118_10655 [Tropicibacter oceani]